MYTHYSGIGPALSNAVAAASLRYLDHGPICTSLELCKGAQMH